MSDPGTDGPVASDADPTIAGFGTGDVAAAVVSMSARHPDGLDADYLQWHLLDHLPEQYRLIGLRWGQRWVSTPACRAARAASVAPFDQVDHVVAYGFAEPVGAALDQFFPLGGALGAIGRMPLRLPRVHLGGWELVGTAAADRVLVGAAVLPWRPAAGAYLLVERTGGPGSPTPDLEALVGVPGVAGAWAYAGVDGLHPRLEPTVGLALTVLYLDGPPVGTAGALAPVLGHRWSDGSRTPVLAAPFELVIPGAWDRHLP